MSLFNLFLCYGYLDHRDLPVLSHSFPTRRSSDLSFWRRRERREQQDQVQLEQVAKLGLGQPVDMETLARREIDHPLAIEPVETVADRGHADPEIVGETGRLAPGAACPFPGHHPTLDPLIGRRAHFRRTPWPFLSPTAHSPTEPPC